MTSLLVDWVLFGLACLLALGLVFLTGWLIYPNVTEEEANGEAKELKRRG